MENKKVFTKEMMEPLFLKRIFDKIDFGEIDKCWNWTGTIGKDNYGQVRLSRIHHGKRSSSCASRFIYKVCYNEPDIKPQQFVCHTCDNPTCCNPNHLFLGSPQDNVDDMVTKKRHSYGEKNHMAKITTEMVWEVKKMLLDGHRMFEIANQLGLTYKTVQHIKWENCWKHLKFA